MNELNLDCAICGVNLFKDRKHQKHILFDGKPAMICSACNSIYTPSVLSKVIVIIKFFDESHNINNFKIEEFGLNVFLNNNFTEVDINSYITKLDSPKLFKFLDKLVVINETKTKFYDFDLMIVTARKHMNRCEVCDKELDYEDSIYFLSGIKRPIQVCKGCSL